MKDPKSVLVIQIASMGVYAFRTSMSDRGLEQEVDFVAFHHPRPVIDCVFENSPQLLITGIVSYEETGLSYFVNELRKKNPQLVVIEFSSVHSPGDFDLRIDKMVDGCWDKLFVAIKEFEEGKLRRKMPVPSQV